MQRNEERLKKKQREGEMSMVPVFCESSFQLRLGPCGTIGRLLKDDEETSKNKIKLVTNSLELLFCFVHVKA